MAETSITLQAMAAVQNFNKITALPFPPLEPCIKSCDEIGNYIADCLFAEMRAEDLTLLGDFCRKEAE